ncbi:MAG TPA: 3-hydroxyacyl-CoA dehydrogenase NAD-binding domain-containing protein, partial [Pirellulales bacterium]|nr:3-hydroxyacyl-CoA dehydrogenase NAD-binding domain-containing protein [Pirellulales bacterium]
MSELVQVSREGNVGILAVNNPPVNALSPGVPAGILHGLAELQQQGAQAIVLIGSGRTFIAGADINEFVKATTGQKKLDPALAQVFAALEDCPVPVVAAIHGTALGGGLEIALACHARVAVATAQVGQPEVKLGLIPGGGGTQRLPRLCGLIKAAELCASGEPISAAEAQRAGIVDRLIEGDLPSGAVAYARELIGRPPRRTRDLPVEPADPQSLATVRSAMEKKARGRTAPLRAWEAVAAAVLPFAEGLKKEAAIFAECLDSEQSKALVHVFFAERAVAKIPGLPRDTPITRIGRAAVVGAGTMGGGIAMNYANAGIPVLLAEVTQDALDRGLATIRKNYAATVQKGRLSEQQMNERLALIEPVLGYDRFGEVDIVAEAVFEGMALKKQVFQQLSRAVRPDAILASNTSTLDIDEIASATDRPQQVIGHHFFSPANVMRLLEIVRGKQTSPAVIATSIALAKKLNKVGVLVGNCRGFVGNRMFFPYQRESQFLLEEGARVDEVDAALTAFGMALGPLAVADLAGLDVGWRIRQEYKHLEPPGVRTPLVEDLLC